MHQLIDYAILLGILMSIVICVVMSVIIKLQKDYKALHAEFRAYKILHHTEYGKINAFMEQQFILNNQLVKGVEIALDIKDYKQQIPYFGVVGEA